MRPGINQNTSCILQVTSKCQRCGSYILIIYKLATNTIRVYSSVCLFNLLFRLVSPSLVLSRNTMHQQELLQRRFFLLYVQLWPLEENTRKACGKLTSIFLASELLSHTHFYNLEKQNTNWHMIVSMSCMKGLHKLKCGDENCLRV